MPTDKNHLAMAMTKRKGPDTLDKTVTYLAKRDGIDKVLKVIRYSTKLALATALKNDSSDLAVRLKEFETSIGTSRKAYRLGKWLSDLNTLRNTPVLTKAGSLELLASGGEGVYYFVEQLTWLVKAGLLDKKYAKRFSTISAWAELVGYVGNVTLNGLRIAAALERELMLTQELVRRKKVSQSYHSLHCLSVAWLLVMHLPKLPLCCSACFKEDMSCQ
ncbi:TPA: hypothetical protein ACH3X1_001864 [Trebouxia sp. C0004]